MQPQRELEQVLQSLQLQPFLLWRVGRHRLLEPGPWLVRFLLPELLALPGLLARRFEQLLLAPRPLAVQRQVVELQRQRCSQLELIPLVSIQRRARPCLRALKLEQVDRQAIVRQLLFQAVPRLMAVLRLEAGHL